MACDNDRTARSGAHVQHARRARRPLRGRARLRHRGAAAAGAAGASDPLWSVDEPKGGVAVAPKPLGRQSRMRRVDVAHSECVACRGRTTAPLPIRPVIRPVGCPVPGPIANALASSTSFPNGRVATSCAAVARVPHYLERSGDESGRLVDRDRDWRECRRVIGNHRRLRIPRPRHGDRGHTIPHVTGRDDLGRHLANLVHGPIRRDDQCGETSWKGI